jgi:glutamate 5-kinase
VEGQFGPGEAVRILGRDGRELGRGLSALGSAELRQILMGDAAGRRQRLAAFPAPLVHRDQLVLLHHRSAGTP